MKTYAIPLICLIWIVIWAVPLYFFGYAIPSSLNELGDSFGIASSFFTAAAFAGMAYSVYVQSDQNKEAAASLERQAKTLDNQAKSMERQAEYLKLTADAQQKQLELLEKAAEYQKRAADAQCQQVEALAKQIEANEKQFQALREQSRNSFIKRLTDEMTDIRDLGASISGVEPDDKVTVEKARGQLGVSYERFLLLVRQVKASDLNNLPSDFKEIIATCSPSLRACFFNAIYANHSKPTLTEEAIFISKHNLLGYVKGAKEKAPMKLKSYARVPHDN